MSLKFHLKCHPNTVNPKMSQNFELVHEKFLHHKNQENEQICT